MFENVNILGLLVALLFAGYGFVRYRRGKWRGIDLFLALFLALGVAVVSVFPQVGDVFKWLIGLENRAFALLSFAVLLLFGLFLWLYNQLRAANRRNGEVVTAIAVRQYMERYGSPEPRGDKDVGEILIIVPAYNEAGSILEVLERVPERVLGYDIKTVIVDDGSEDGTEQVSLAAGYPVAAHVVNRGQGDALRTGFEIAQRENADIVINLDADGQYKPEEIELLVAPIIKGEADFVLGSRFAGFYEEAGSVRHVGVVFFSKLISFLTGVWITDCTNGFRAIRVSELHKLDLREDRFNATEIILEALRNKLRFKEVPVTMLRRAEGESKKPKRLAYPLGVFRVIIETWLR
ncbi:MAG: DUF2304 family protein [Actinomycetota bacterium]|nr:DUF2304 family protein [Actinomycetota bacterium]HZY66484.1 DUF2304 family protein [Rubrobacteraceae bacterium]